MPVSQSVGNFLRSVFRRETRQSEVEPEKQDVITGDYSLYSSFGMGGVDQFLKLERSLLGKYADYEDMDDYPDISCLGGDTIVRTIDGPRTIEELARENPNVFHVLAYDLSNGRVVVAEAKQAQKTGHMVETVGVELDNGSVTYCTPEHLWMMRNGEYCEAQYLKPFDSLMPAQTRLYQGYMQVFHPEKQYSSDGKRWEPVYKLVAKAKFGFFDNDKLPHHFDKNKLNDSWGNIELVDRSEHCVVHLDDLRKSGRLGQHEWTEEEKQELAERMRGNSFALGQTLSEETKRKMSEAHKGKKKSAEWRKKIGDAQRMDLDVEQLKRLASTYTSVQDIARAMGVSWSKAKRELVRNGIELENQKVKRRAANNHRVIRVFSGPRMDVFDIKVPKYRNFAIGSGTFVHNSGWDIYADDATQVDGEKNQTLWVESPDENIRADLEEMYDKRVKTEEESWEITRLTGKYGNDYEEILVNDNGVQGLSHLPPATVRRYEGDKGSLIGFAQSFKNRFSVEANSFKGEMDEGISRFGSEDLTLFEPWKVVHFRMRMRERKALYGNSIFENARWIYKRLLLLEDSALIYRLTRAPARFAFYIDVGDLPAKEALAYVEKIKNKYKKQKFVNEQGKLDMRYNPLCLAGDTRISLLDGRSPTIIELVKEFEEGKENWVYSVDRENENRVVPGKITWAGGTRKNAELLEVELDSGKVVRATPDHKFILRTGEYREAKDLKPGDSLMPLKRLVATHEKGYSMDGYEMVYDPSTKKYVYTHRMIANELESERQEVTHHKDFNKFNNHPDNLERLSRKEHMLLHVENGHNIGEWAAERRKVDKDFDDRLRDAARKVALDVLVPYSRMDETRARISERNRQLDQGRFIREYNKSEKHEQDNPVRSKLKTEFWKDEQRRQKAMERMRVRFSDSFYMEIRRFVANDSGASAEDVVDFINKTPELLKLLTENNSSKTKRAHRHLLLKMYRQKGFNNFGEFKKAASGNNHKVVAIRKVEQREDTYTLSIGKWGNFGLDVGIYIKNSKDEDFFVPTRKGQESTRIDMLTGPEYQSMEDVDYFRMKLYAAMKIPRAYLGYEDTISRATLSQEDVRFARSVLRLQREIRNGFHKVGRVHLAAKGLDPAATEFEVYMTVPSAVFELAQMEVRNARVALANEMREWASERWIWENVFGFTDTEIESIMKQRLDDAVRLASIEGRQEKIRMGQIPPELRGFTGEMGAEEMGAGGQAGAGAGAGENEVVRLYRGQSFSERRFWNQLEKRLLHGNKKFEKSISPDQLEEVIRGNADLNKRIKEIRLFLNDLKGAVTHRRAA